MIWLFTEQVLFSAVCAAEEELSTGPHSTPLALEQRTGEGEGLSKTRGKRNLKEKSKNCKSLRLSLTATRPLPVPRWTGIWWLVEEAPLLPLAEGSQPY